MNPIVSGGSVASQRHAAMASRESEHRWRSDAIESGGASFAVVPGAGVELRDGDCVKIGEATSILAKSETCMLVFSNGKYYLLSNGDL